jgi:hypothetical protein
MRSPGILLKTLSLSVIAIAGIVAPTGSASVSGSFRIDAELLPQEKATLKVNVCYNGHGKKEIRAPDAGDLKIIAPGKWLPKPPPHGVIEAATGSPVVETLGSGDCMTLFFALKDLFASATPGKNTLEFELSIPVLSDDGTAHLRKTIELNLTPEQAQNVSK